MTSCLSNSGSSYAAARYARGLGPVVATLEICPILAVDFD
jgi:hypothetical protein